MKRCLLVITVTFTVFLRTIPVAYAVEPFCPGGSFEDPAVIWCDDFEDATPVSQKYFEYNDDDGDFIRLPSVGLNGSFGMRVKWQPGEAEAGNLKRLFGRVPPGFRSQSHPNQNFREVYWRQYLKMEPGWTGQAYKLSRATILARSNRAQAMIAHVWGSGDRDTIGIDPATGIDGNNRLVTTQYNDFANLRWLGFKSGTFPLYAPDSAATWHCIEAHAKLNTPGRADGVLAFWINGQLEARADNLNWVGTWQEFGINAVFFENYWNDGPPGQRIRYIDNIVISTERIGCVADQVDVTPPVPPTGLRVIEIDSKP